MAPSKEPEYITKDERGKVTDIRLTFYGVLENNDGSFKTNHSFSIFLKNKYKENSAEKWDSVGHKYLFIDKYGNTTWSTDPLNVKPGIKFDSTNTHKIFEGEDVLINLIIAMNPDIVTSIWDYDSNTKSFSLKNDANLADAECYLEQDTIKKIWSGNLEDLLVIFKGACTVGTQIKIAVGSKENNAYPVTYTRSFISGVYTIDRAINLYKKLIEKNCSRSEHYNMVPVKSGVTAMVNNSAVSSVEDMPPADDVLASDDMPFDED